MPTVHEIATLAKVALRDGWPLETRHNPTGSIVAVWHGQLPAAGDEKMPKELTPTGQRARVLSLAFFDPRTRSAMSLDPARALSWLEMILGEDRKKAFVSREEPTERRRLEVWNFYVCYLDGKAHMPAYTKAMGDAGIVPYFALYEKQFVAARKALRESRTT